MAITLSGARHRFAFGPAVAFVTAINASDLVPGDTNGKFDVFLHGPR